MLEKDLAVQIRILKIISANFYQRNILYGINDIPENH